VNYDSLKLFRDIAQFHSFSKGAAINGFSQSAASQHVQELEKSLGVELLDRSTRPLAITPAGRLYGDYCKDILRRKEDFAVALEKLKSQVEGTVRVAAIYSVGLGEMVEIEKAFSHLQPDAQLEVEYLRPERVYEAVLADEADLGLISYPEARKDIHVISWREEEMVVAAAPMHPLALEGEAISATRLNGLDFIGFDEDLPIRRHLDRFLKDLGAEVNITLHFDNLQMIKEAVAHRVGISIMPARLMMDDIAQGRLVAIRIDGAVLFRPFGIIHRKKKRFNRVAQAFLELLCEKPGPDFSPA
jgi:DNA-binding transcriptional LysR family regulator